MKSKYFLIGPLSVALAAPLATAHHSFAMFEPEKTVTTDATVENVEWTNPHIWINLLIVNAKGEPEKWGMETGATNTVLRWGWKRNSLKPGDKINLTFHPMKDGSHSGSPTKITTASGEDLLIGVQGARPADDKGQPASQ
jgi:hypothetical protein